MKWAIKLNAFALEYVLLKAMKRHMLTNFLAQHSCIEVQNPLAKSQGYVQVKPWTLAFDRSKHRNGVGAGVVITSPKIVDKKFMYRLDVQCSDNQAGYEALIISLKLLRSLDVKTVQIMGYSQLLINQLLGEYKYNNPTLEEYIEEAKELLEHFVDVIISHILRTFNEVANDLAQHIF